MNRMTGRFAKSIEIDGETAWFFLTDGGAVAIRNRGAFLEVIDIRGVTTLAIDEKVELTLRESNSERKLQEETGKEPDPFAVFNLKPPVTVNDVAYYRDGGTVSFTIVDARGNRLLAGFSRRLGEQIRPFYVGAKLPKDQGAKSLPIGRVEERALVAVLNSWLDQRLSLEEQKFLANYGSSENSDEHRELYYVLKVIKETEIRRLTDS